MRLNRHQKGLIDEAHRWAREHDGEPPKVKDWKGTSTPGSSAYGYPSYLTAVRAFRTWDRFIQECGWEPRGRGRPRKPC